MSSSIKLSSRLPPPFCASHAPILCVCMPNISSNGARVHCALLLMGCDNWSPYLLDKYVANTYCHRVLTCLRTSILRVEAIDLTDKNSSFKIDMRIFIISQEFPQICCSASLIFILFLFLFCLFVIFFFASFLQNL